ncbi:MAG: hypothetical protein LBJ74_05340 [Heliobacteriaceae bacterium]|nr:hypothetical protein [Heliobacteriaceae bacterium]
MKKILIIAMLLVSIPAVAAPSGHGGGSRGGYHSGGHSGSYSGTRSYSAGSSRPGTSGSYSRSSNYGSRPAYNANYSRTYTPARVQSRPVVVNKNHYTPRHYTPRYYYRPSSFVWGFSTGLVLGSGWYYAYYYASPGYQTSYKIVNYVYQDAAQEPQPVQAAPQNCEEECNIYCNFNSRGECICPY